MERINQIKTIFNEYRKAKKEYEMLKNEPAPPGKSKLEHDDRLWELERKIIRVEKILELMQSPHEENCEIFKMRYSDGFTLVKIALELGLGKRDINTRLRKAGEEFLSLYNAVSKFDDV